MLTKVHGLKNIDVHSQAVALLRPESRMNQGVVVKQPARTGNQDSVYHFCLTYLMPFTEFTKKLIETKLNDYCERRIPVDVRDQVRLTYRV